MAEDKNSSLATQVIAGLVVASIIGAVSFVLGAFKWVMEVAAIFWNHLTDASTLPNWSLYLLALMGLNTIIYWASLVIKPKGLNPIAAYTHDTFLGLKWRWSYISGSPTNAWAFCPECDTMLVYSELGRYFDPVQKTVLTCETCCKDMLNHEGDRAYLVEKIHRQIDRKIRTGEWKHIVESNA
ncbi:MAG: hypothetical protein RJB34_1495 [Pseudomonadota bacterium]